jgi:hypothetical protein
MVTLSLIRKTFKEIANMGQYYFPVELEKMEHLYSHDFGCGLKLMEHSWIENDMCQAVEMLLVEGGRWDKHKIVWAGDYADEEQGTAGTKAPDGTIYENDVNLQSMLDDKNKLKFLIEACPPDHHFLINFDKKEYVDKRNLKGVKYDGGTALWTIHPLPLLTCEGNGRGGGDFNGKDPKNLVGSWARNSIGLRKEVPAGFKELKFNLKE